MPEVMSQKFQAVPEPRHSLRSLADVCGDGALDSVIREALTSCRQVRDYFVVEGAVDYSGTSANWGG
jgi:hypothetical protein